MDPQTVDIVRLAWTRGLGLPDDAFAPRDGVRCIVDDGIPRIEFLELFGRRVLRGPERWAAMLAESPASAFHDGSALSALDRSGAAGHAALRTTVRERLAYRDHYERHGIQGAPPHPGPAAGQDGRPSPVRDADTPTISHALDDAAQVLAQCPPDDAAAVTGYLCDAARCDPAHPGDGPPAPFTLVVDGRRTALAGYRTMHGLLADVRAATAPPMRRRGHARTAAVLAAEDALDDGLVCQARWSDESAAAASLAARLGFTHAGSRVVISSAREYHR